MKEKKCRRLLLPCPIYDMENMEAWLEEKALEGLFLAEDGFFLSTALFEKGTPHPVRYRLLPREKKRGFDDNNAPEDEALELAEESGWSYVAAKGDFFVYKTEDPSAVELSTDGKVKAMAMKYVCRNEIGNVIGALVWLLIVPFLWLRGAVLCTMMLAGTFFVSFGFLLLAYLFFDALSKALYLERLRRDLQMGRERKKRKRRGRLYIGRKALFIICVIVWFAILFSQWSKIALDEDKIPLSEYTGSVPFATLSDFAAEESLEHRFNDYSNRVMDKSDVLAPRLISWDENAEFVTADGRKISGGLYIEYFETVSNAAAKRVAHELLQREKRSRHYKELDFSAPDFDYAIAFNDKLHFPNILVRDGERVLRARFYQTGSEKLSLDEWSAVILNSLQ